MRRLQMLQTTTTLLLIAIARVVNPRVDREFWVIPRPGVGWFEVILEVISWAYGYDGALSLCCVRFGVESILIF